MVVVTVKSLGGQTVERFTMDLGNRWGIGRRGINDGIIVLLAPNDRKVRIEVGPGLQSPLSNELTKRIIDERMLPRFRKSDFYGGLVAGVDALIARLQP